MCVNHVFSLATAVSYRCTAQVLLSAAFVHNCLSPRAVVLQGSGWTLLCHRIYVRLLSPPLAIEQNKSGRIDMYDILFNV